MVLDQGHGHDVLPVGEHHLGELLADGPLLEDDAGASDVPVEDLADVLHGLLEAVEVLPLDLDALPAGQSDGLDDDLVVDAFQVRFRVLGVVEAGEREVPGDAVLLDQLPHERFGCLDPGGVLRGGRASDPCGFQRIDDPDAEGRLRTYERELDAVLLCEGHDLVDVLLVAEQVFLRPCDDSGVGVLHHAVEFGAGAVQGLDGRMLPPASSDGQDLHMYAPQSFRAARISSSPSSFLTLHM